MSIHRLTRLVDRRRPLLGAQLRFGSPSVAELFALAGFDFLVIDGEHAPQTPVGVQTQLQAMACADVVPVMRLPNGEPDLVRMYLDMGAVGIMVPFVSTAEQAQQIAATCRYPPQGTRGFGPARAARYGFDANYYQRFNSEVAFLPMIETAESIGNIDAIAQTPGVDMLMIGPVDLSISLGQPFELEHPSMRDALRMVSEAARRAGKLACMPAYGDPTQGDNLKRFLDQEFDALLVGGDEWMLQSTSKRVVDTFNEIRS